MFANIEFHPYANIFPLMTPDESNRHVADIKARGLDEPIVLYQGMILDGRNRYRSCAAAGVDPKFVDFDGDDSAALAFVIGKNLHRRQLTSSQSSMCSLEAEKHFGEIAAKRKQELSGTRSNPGEQDEEKIPQPRAPQARDQAAKDFGTNPRYVSDAKKIADASPETAEKVKRGEVTIPQAKKDLGIGKPKQPPKPKGQSMVNGVLQDDPPEIAKKRAKGLIAEGVVPNVTTVNEGGQKVADVKEDRDEQAAKQQDADSDEEWLAALPLTSQLTGYPLNVFKADALFYRHIEPYRKSFSKKVAEFLNKSRRRGAYGNRIELALSNRPPKEWKICPPLDTGGCGGTGQIKTIGQCSKCFARGYLIF